MTKYCRGKNNGRKLLYGGAVGSKQVAAFVKEDPDDKDDGEDKDDRGEGDEGDNGIGAAPPENLETVDEKVFERDVTVLRNNGCSTAIVNEEFVKQEAYFDRHETVVFLNGTKRELPGVGIANETHYLSGDVKA